MFRFTLCAESKEGLIMAISFRSNHPILWKIFICALIMIVMFIPVASAFSFASFLPAAFAVPGLGEALMVVAVVAAGVYVGTQYGDDIVHEINIAYDNISSYWNGMTSSVQEKWNEVADNFSITSTEEQTFTMDSEMKESVNDFLKESGAVTTVESTTTTVPMKNFNRPEGLSVGSTWLMDGVLSYYALKVVYKDEIYYLVPTKAYWYNSTGQFQVPVEYRWVKQISSNNTQVISQLRTTAGSSIGITFSPEYTGPRVVDQVMQYPAQDYYSIPQSIPSGIDHYKDYIEEKLGITTIPAPWVDVHTPGLQLPEIGDTIKVPPGVITGNPGDYIVNVTDAQADVIGDITVADPPVVDHPPLDPPTGTINWEPLKMVGTVFTNKFPFSIPWDVKRQLDVFNVSPTAPTFSIHKSFSVGGQTVPIDFEFSLSNFDVIADIIRWCLTIAFDLAVILSMRRFMPQ